MLVKQLSKITMVFFNTMVLSQNFKNTLFSNTPIGHVCSCFLTGFSSWKDKSRNKQLIFQLIFETLKKQVYKKNELQAKKHI
jgi:hypothetical protein